MPDAENYIDFQRSTDEGDMYDTFRMLKSSVELDSLKDEPDEEVFMSLEELGISPGNDDIIDKTNEYVKDKGTEEEVAFMSLAEIRASLVSHSRESKCKSNYYNLGEETEKNLKVSSARHSHPGYINLPKSDCEKDSVQYSAVKDETEVHTDYYNLRSLDTKNKEASGLFHEHKESYEPPEYNILENVYEVEKRTSFPENNYGTDTYDHTNQTKKGRHQYGYSHIEFSAGKSMTTVEEWLTQLDMLCYKHNFLDNGWDSLCFLNEMTASELAAIGVLDAEDQYIILKSIRSFNNS